jgi:hypothetical protein
MDKYEQITKLAQAAMLIQEVLNVCDPDVADDLQDTANSIANIADQIEGVA